ncbi:MinD/ParA family protein [Bacillus luteolus]|uniref:MinD/ParA family protein n=1 Tax=Litchfieldia luteola TaxID=682179 RepID=A0ABR9QJM9_9BACI|nr:MinD/ParA family protein [Cytobacillus luteolus]MBE4908710.1 MinD/ParA family protein [Cytobacillus luteolus]MBP1941569.1 flagellar biosynthesis protein FlhG [Cytobacillus luteolus]
MKDQAESLRIKLQQKRSSTNHTTSIAVISGKGGVGKSNLSLNFALSLKQQGKSVLLFDMDIGMGNIDILMGVTSQHTVVDMLDNQLPINEIIQEGSNGLAYISGGSGLSSIFTMEFEKIDRFFEQLQLVLPQYEYVIFDMGAGMTNESLQFLIAMDEIFIVTTPEPTSITDAYAAMKYIYSFNNTIPYYLVVNRAQSENEGKQTLQRLSNVVSRFLNKETIQLGILPDDKTVSKAVSHQTPYILYSPKSMISRAIESLTSRYLENTPYNEGLEMRYSFITKLKRLIER